MTPTNALAVEHVRPHQPMICVGVSDSHPSVAALRFAFDEASRRGASVKVVTSWAIEKYGNYGIGVTEEERERYESQTRHRQEETIERALSGVDERPPIVQRIIQSIGPHPGQDLVQESKNCELLVVGTRHKGVLRPPSFIATSTYCVRHACVPVAIVPRDVAAVA